MGKHYVCDKHKTKGNTGKCPFCYPGHIADATGKAQPAPALPGDDGEICARLLSACTGHPHALIPWPHRLLHDAVSHISDLTRRLAEAEKSAWEECHAMSSRLSKANQESNMWRNCAVYLDYRGADYCVAIHKELDGLQEDNRKHREQVSKLLAEWKRRAEAAEARVRELEATIDAMTEAHAHDDQALTAAYLSGAHEGKKQAEAERDALREALTEIVYISDYEMYDECAHSIPLEDCHKLAQAALAATEVK